MGQQDPSASYPGASGAGPIRQAGGRTPQPGHVPGQAGQAPMPGAPAQQPIRAAHAKDGLPSTAPPYIPSGQPGQHAPGAGGANPQGAPVRVRGPSGGYHWRPIASWEPESGSFSILEVMTVLLVMILLLIVGVLIVVLATASSRDVASVILLVIVGLLFLVSVALISNYFFPELLARLRPGRGAPPGGIGSHMGQPAPGSGFPTTHRRKHDAAASEAFEAPGAEDTLLADEYNQPLTEALPWEQPYAQPAPQPPPPPMQAATFEEKEPDDPGDPVDHKAELKTDPDKQHWVILGSSQRGLSHKHDGKYREDALAGHNLDGWHLIAVADGGGAYKLARVGANRAVQVALGAMMQAVVRGAPHTAEGVATILLSGLQSAYEDLYQEAERRQTELGQPVTVRDLRTTLLLLVHREQKNGTHLVGGVQVGDGVIVGRDQDRRLHMLGKPDIGPSGNESLFLPDCDPQTWPQRVIINESMQGSTCYFMAMTDGVSDDFAPVEQNLYRLEQPLFQSILQEKDRKKQKTAAQELTKLLSYERTGSFDDRTLVCLYKVGEKPWK